MSEASIDGASIAYAETGSGPPVLLIHGTAAALWAELPEQLADVGHRVIAYDRRSFGGSQQPPVSDLNRHVRDAAALLETLDAAPATVVGWSMGGVIALALAIARPELVSALVLIEPPLHAKRHPSPRMMAGIVRAKVLERRGRPEEGAEAFSRWATRERSGGSTFEKAPPEIRELVLSNSEAILAELDGGTGEEITREALAEIACPVVCLLGTNSDQAYEGAAKRLARRLPSVQLVTIEGAGHVMPLDAPGAIVDAVASVHANR
jgi:pimeloyl-ACP methyl ester carboxylesterase